MFESALVGDIRVRVGALTQYLRADPESKLLSVLLSTPPSSVRPIVLSPSWPATLAPSHLLLTTLTSPEGPSADAAAHKVGTSLVFEA
jgi:hypothetical protein